MARLPDERRAAWAFAAAVAGLCAPLAYFAQRLIGRGLGEGLDPRLIVRESHTAFYWRSVLSLWIAIVVVIGVALILRSGPRERVVGVVRFAVLPVGLLLAFVYWRLP